MKIAVVGGGRRTPRSSSTASAGCSDVLPVEELVLVDPDRRPARAGRRARPPDPRAGWAIRAG